MAQTMTPSTQRKPITDGQIDKAVAAYRAMLCKHRNELASEAAQQVLGLDDYINEQVGVLRRRIEAVSDMIVRHVKVDRTRTPAEVLKATGRRQYVNDSVVAGMPRVEGEEEDVYFFPVRRDITDTELEKEFDLRGLEAVDAYSLAAVNEADPAFADECPNATHWKDADSKWCYAAFYRWDDGGRDVNVDRDGSRWIAHWWFAGRRKK